MYTKLHSCSNLASIAIRGSSLVFSSVAVMHKNSGWSSNVHVTVMSRNTPPKILVLFWAAVSHVVLAKRDRKYERKDTPAFLYTLNAAFALLLLHRSLTFPDGSKLCAGLVNLQMDSYTFYECASASYHFVNLSVEYNL